MPHGIVKLVDMISYFVCGRSCYDLDEQLHLGEFAALEMKRMNDAMAMDLLVRQKPFRDEKQGGMINDVDSEDEPEKANARHTEFLGGARQSECSEVEDTDGDPRIRRQACKKLELDDCKAMLRRVQEIERASAPGRHKEADAQMKGYAVAFPNAA
jgi:hypothetical protein